MLYLSFEKNLRESPLSKHRICRKNIISFSSDGPQIKRTLSSVILSHRTSCPNWNLNKLLHWRTDLPVTVRVVTGWPSGFCWGLKGCLRPLRGSWVSQHVLYCVYVLDSSGRISSPTCFLATPGPELQTPASCAEGANQTEVEQ